MPRTKQTHVESFFHNLDRLPEKEGIFRAPYNAVRILSDFYGFEKISYSLFDDIRAYQQLIKAGYTAERLPIGFKFGTASDVIARFSSVLSALRAFRSHKMHDFPQPIKLFCEGEVFFTSSREDQPIQRRDEASLIMIGEAGPIAEAQIVQVIWKSLQECGIASDRLTLMVNAIGCNQCFNSFRSSLSSHVRNKVAGLCKNCKRNFKSTPTRLLVCEEEKCRIATSHAPQLLDHLCENCKKHLRGFLEFLDEMGIAYYIDARRFRTGFWADTILFEFMYASGHATGVDMDQGMEGETDSEGENNADDMALSSTSSNPQTGGRRGVILAEGGRLSRAAELMGIKDINAVAGNILIDVVGQILANSSLGRAHPDIYLAQLGEMARRRSLKVLEMLRLAGITVRESLGRDAIKSQLKLAEKFHTPIALILGQKEVIDETIIVRETESGIQETVPQEKMIDFLKRRLKKENQEA